MSLVEEYCGHSCSCGKGGCDDAENEKSSLEIDIGHNHNSDACGEDCRCDDSDDGFGDYHGEDSDRLMRDRDRARLQETMEKVRSLQTVLHP